MSINISILTLKRKIKNENVLPCFGNPVGTWSMIIEHNLMQCIRRGNTSTLHNSPIPIKQNTRQNPTRHRHVNHQRQSRRTLLTCASSLSLVDFSTSLSLSLCKSRILPLLHSIPSTPFSFLFQNPFSFQLLFTTFHLRLIYNPNHTS